MNYTESEESSLMRFKEIAGTEKAPLRVYTCVYLSYRDSVHRQKELSLWTLAIDGLI